MKLVYYYYFVFFLSGGSVLSFDVLYVQIFIQTFFTAGHDIFVKIIKKGGEELINISSFT